MTEDLKVVERRLGNSLEVETDLLEPSSRDVLEVRMQSGVRNYCLTTPDGILVIVSYGTDGGLESWEEARLGAVINIIDMPKSETAILREEDALPDKVKEMLQG